MSDGSNPTTGYENIHVGYNAGKILPGSANIAVGKHALDTFHARNAHLRHKPSHWTEDEWQRHLDWYRSLRLSPLDRAALAVYRVAEIELPEWLIRHLASA